MGVIAKLLNPNHLLNRKYIYRLFSLIFVVFGSVVAILTSIINYHVQYANIELEINKKLTSEKIEKLDIIQSFTRHNKNQMSAIAQSNLTQAFVTSPSSLNETNLKQLMLAVTRANVSYTQLRIIGTSGRELIRLDKIDGQLHIADTLSLQNKKNRYYFDAAIQLQQNRFWYSNFDLNVEHGEIELPIKPTLRISTPLFFNGIRYGFVIANINISPLLSLLSNSDNFDTYLIDSNGEFIIHPNPENTWSKYLQGRSDFTQQFPDKLAILEREAVSTSDVYSFGFNALIQNQDEAKLVFIPKQAFLTQFAQNNLLTSALTAVTVLIISFILSWVAALIPAKLQHALSKAYQEIKRYTQIIDKHVITSTTDTKGVIINASSALADVSGYKVEEMIGKRHSIITHQNTPKSVHKDIWQTITRGETWYGEILDKGKQGNNFWLNHVITPDFDHDGSIKGYTSISSDISLRKKIEAISLIDSLTQLSNRRGLDKRLAEELIRTQRYKKHFSILIMDIDNFKTINDNYGHCVGDEILIQVAALLQTHTRKSDLVGRWGGEEFLLICPETDLDGASRIGELLRETIAEHDFKAVSSVTISLGVAYSSNKDNQVKLFARADKALYQAKQQGKNQLVTQDELTTQPVFNPSSPKK